MNTILNNLSHENVILIHGDIIEKNKQGGNTFKNAVNLKQPYGKKIMNTILNSLYLDNATLVHKII